MVRLQLSIKAELENVTDLQPLDDSFEWFFDVTCGSCREPHPKPVSMNKLQEREMTHGKGSTAHFVWKCSNCKREHSAKFETPPSSKLTYRKEHSENQEFAPLVILDCRGLEFTGFHPQGTWKCVGSESGTQFMEVDLSEKEWTDYDEKAKMPVGIMELESKWERA